MTDPTQDTGASPEEQLLLACRSDNIDLFDKLVSAPDTQLNVNTTDALGMTPLHLCVLFQATEILGSLLDEEVDVDLRERTKGDTPLHTACRIEGKENEELRNWIVEQLLSAGADPKIKNSANEKPEDLLLGPARETDFGQSLRQMLREAEAQLTFAATGDVVDEDEGSSGDEHSDDDE